MDLNVSPKPYDTRSIIWSVCYSKCWSIPNECHAIMPICQYANMYRRKHLCFESWSSIFVIILSQVNLRYGILVFFISLVWSISHSPSLSFKLFYDRALNRMEEKSKTTISQNTMKMRAKRRAKVSWLMLIRLMVQFSWMVVRLMKSGVRMLLPHQPESNWLDECEIQFCLWWLVASKMPF